MTAPKPKPLACPFCGAPAERARHSEAVRCKRGCTGWMHRDDWDSRAASSLPDRKEQP